MEAHEFDQDLHELKPEPKPKKQRPKVISHILTFLTIHPRIAVIILIAIIVLSLSLGFSYQSHISSRTVRFGLENVGKLITQSGYFTNVQVIENSIDLKGWKIPFTTTKCIFSYDGIVTAGMDFTEIDVDTNPLTKEIHVTLPEVQIFSVDVDQDSMEIYDESKSIFTPLSLNDMNIAYQELEEEVRAQAIENGILENAKANAITLVQNMISSSFDTSEYTFSFDA